MHFLLLLVLLCSCSKAEESSVRRRNQVAMYIDRHHDEHLFKSSPATWQPPERYPWEAERSGKHLRITKEFFRCRGCELNPVRIVDSSYYHDCGGAERHSLPLRDGKEFVYPILIDLLNYLQNQTDKKIVITSGHRCPTHNTYVNPSPSNNSSKHLIGAEVSFYLQGLENKPEQVVEIIKSYYLSQPKYSGEKAFIEFERYDKETDVSTLPWYNKEIFVKVYQKDEGRDFDNRHPYPYLSIQVRYDWDKKERVQYTWKESQRNFLRW